MAIPIPIPTPIVPFPGVVAWIGCGHRRLCEICEICGDFLFEYVIVFMQLSTKARSTGSE
jgi:hypothetical protein